MNKIPQDILKQAVRVYAALGRGSNQDTDIISRALMAERERCAQIAEMHDTRGDIAASIRLPTPSPGKERG